MKRLSAPLAIISMATVIGSCGQIQTLPLGSNVTYYIIKIVIAFIVFMVAVSRTEAWEPLRQRKSPRNVGRRQRA